MSQTWFPNTLGVDIKANAYMYICVSELTIIGSDNGLSPGRRQAIILNNAGLLLIQPLGTNVSEISIEFSHFHSRKCP